MNDISVRPPTPRMAAFLLAGAALTLHAALSRALPNHALGSAWVNTVQSACRSLPGCLGAHITPTTGLMFWARRKVQVSASPGHEEPVLAAVQESLGLLGRIYSDVEITRSSGVKK